MTTKIDIDYSKIDNIKWENIDWKDYPDFCDAHICSADYDGEPMTNEQLENLDPDWVYDKLLDYIF